MKICLYGSASTKIAQQYIDAVYNLANQLAWQKPVRADWRQYKFKDYHDAGGCAKKDAKNSWQDSQRRQGRNYLHSVITKNRANARFFNFFQEICLSFRGFCCPYHQTLSKPNQSSSPVAQSSLNGRAASTKCWFS